LVLAYDFHKMRDLGDHAARLRRVRQLDDAADPVELEPDRDLPMLMMPPYRATGLLDRYYVTYMDARLGAAKLKSKPDCTAER